MRRKIDKEVARQFVWGLVKKSNRTVYAVFIGSNLHERAKAVRVALFISADGEVINISQYASVLTGLKSYGTATAYLETPKGYDGAAYATRLIDKALNEGVFMKERLSAKWI